MCIIPNFPAALLDDPPPQPLSPTAAAARDQQHQNQCSSEDEHSPKVRKPYTITKQREKWSDEEHDKFLEAVKMYGRAWRRIEEHVGTKTAVQIRSHAQKFFSKVARESTTGGDGNNSCDSSSSPLAVAATAAPAMIIEIPPPRPKKRPLHPYPRKQGSTPKKRASASAAAISVKVPHGVRQLEHACVHHQQQEEENGSPKSVLSAAAGEMNLRAATYKGYGACASSDSSITGPAEEVPRGNEMADGASTMSNGGSDSFEAVTRRDTEQAQPTLVSFQLFGQTVVVSSPENPSASTEASSWLQETDNHPPTSSSDPANSGSMTMAIDSQGSETTTPTTPEAVSCPCGVMPILCPHLPTQPEQQQQASQQQCPEHGSAPQPWWFFYGGAVALPFVRLPVLTSSQQQQQQQQHDDECCGTDGDSSSGASADSVNRQEASISPKTTSVDRDGQQSGERCPRSAFSHQGRGFVPYKRQVAAQQPRSPRPCSPDSQNAVDRS